jgi:hypothetical protein
MFVSAKECPVIALVGIDGDFAGTDSGGKLASPPAEAFVYGCLLSLE